MDVGVPVKNFLMNRRNRTVGAILGWSEERLKPQISPADWEALRRVVQDATNSYHDVVLDLVKSESGTRNEYVIQLLERIDTQVSRRPVETT